MKDIKDNTTLKLNFVLIFCASLFCLLGTILMFSGDPDNITGGIIISCMSFPILIAIILLTICNIRVGIKVDNKGVEIKRGFFKTYFFHYDDIKDVIPTKTTVGFSQSLAINIYLKNGKQFCVGPIKNLYEKIDYIKDNISASEYDLFNYGKYQDEEKELRKKAKTKILFTISLWLLFFFELVLTILLTDGRAIVEYTPTDKVIFTCYCIVSVLTYIITFIMTVKAYKLFGQFKPYISLLLKKEVLTTTILENKDIFSKNLINNIDINYQNMVGAYTNAAYSCRTTVFKTTADESKYFYVHETFEVRKGSVRARIYQGAQAEGRNVKQAIKRLYFLNGDKLIAIKN